jgi:hypothetical protein
MPLGALKAALVAWRFIILLIVLLALWKGKNGLKQERRRGFVGTNPLLRSSSSFRKFIDIIRQVKFSIRSAFGN